MTRIAAPLPFVGCSSKARFLPLLLILFLLLTSAAIAQPTTTPPPRANPRAAIALQDRFDEFMRVLNGDFARLKPEMFSAAFREQMPIGPFGEAIKEQYEKMRGFKMLGSNASGSYMMTAWLRSVSDEKDWDLSLGIETQAPYAIDTLTLQARPRRAALGYDGWPLLDRDLETLIERPAFALHEILPDGALRPVHRVNADQRMAVGTASKIWVLGALVEKIARQEAQWTDRMVIQNEFKSLPALGFGVTPTGFDFPVRDFAIHMMANSDTTAMDHLLNFVGREAVEELKASDRSGQDGPGSVFGASASKNDPFLSTMDLYRLTCTVDAQLIRKWASGSTETRRKMLQEDLVGATVLLELFELWAKPQEIESVGWFATANELSRAAARIWVRGQDPSMRAGTLGAVEAPESAPIDRDLFKYVGYFTGGLPGVFAGTWLFERVDGRVFVMSFILNNPKHVISDPRLASIIEAAQGLVGRMPAEAKE